MTIKKYLSKRSFENTPEPTGHSAPRTHLLRFVVQKHAARHLHYDFRLEYRDVLLSWAVPKGPSLDPKDKRLAIQVEDHPIAYQHFEGTIPKGNYGAGTVEIWDHGFFTAHGATSAKDIERYLTEGLAKGHFAITLSGEKLNGEFVFQKLKRDPNSREWLLIKKEDVNATSEAALKPPHKEKSETSPRKKKETASLKQ